MPEGMSISVNGQSQVPPGFRFHPTEEELLQYYLRKKVSYEQIDLDVIRDVDLNKLEPWDIQERCKIGTTPQNDWYFFSHKDKKYPTGTRTNRATAAGFWKATGRDKVIHSNSRRIGMRKTLVFYKGRAPHGQKSDWIMHEYRLDDNIINGDCNIITDVTGEATQEEGWVVCRIFKKKNHHKIGGLDSPMVNLDTKSHHHIPNSSSDQEGTLEQILQSMVRNSSTSTSSCKSEGQPNSGYLIPITTSYVDKFMKLPSLDSPPNSSYHHFQGQLIPEDDTTSMANHFNGNNNSSSSSHEQGLVYSSNQTGLSDWAALDRLVASQLNGQAADTTAKQLACFNDSSMGFCFPNRAFDSDTHGIDNGTDQLDLWSHVSDAHV